MKIKNKAIILTLAILFIVNIIFSYASEKIFEGKIIPINNTQYFQTVIERIKNAHRSVLVIMFLASYYPEYPDSPSNQILKALIEKKKENIKIEVILEETQSDYFQHTKTENLKTASFLSQNGVPVYFDSPFKTTHSKLIIIDEKYVIIGSHNWTYSALTKNNESSVLIESEQLAKYYIRYFEKIKGECKTKFIPRSYKNLQPAK